MKNVFRNFEENCGWKSCVKFLDYVEEFESKRNFEKIKKMYKEFSEGNCIKKDYINFRKFCLNK